MVAKGLKQLNQESPKTLYNLAEANRLFKCKQLSNIKDQIKASLSDTKSIDNLNDIYNLFLLQKGADSYGVKRSEEF